MRPARALFLASLAVACAPAEREAPEARDALSGDVRDGDLQDLGLEDRDAGSAPDAALVPDVGPGGPSDAGPSDAGPGDTGPGAADASPGGGPSDSGASGDAAALSWVSLGQAPTPISLTREIDTAAYHAMLL
jgi:hypothetical protein